MSISELSLLNKAVVFVPLPTAAEDHQTKNAMSLVNANAAIIVKNSETEKELLPVVFDLLKNVDKQDEMKDNIAKFARPNAAEDIVDQIEMILNK
jgi:UDP-N-acetylglucosamine--N-acetylmuramyl-(pentapeptide) pyrophosphoryl-undecaprenol N-acetylglucosamine transferase